MAAAVANQSIIIRQHFPWNTFSLSWNHIDTHKSSDQSSNNNESIFGPMKVAFTAKIAVSSKISHRNNYIDIIDIDSRLRDADASKLSCRLQHCLPPTRIKWSYSHLVPAYSQRFLAVSGNDVHIYKDFSDDSSPGSGQYQHCRKLSATTGSRKFESSAPIANIEWNFVDPSILGTCSIDTTCTIWNVETGQPKTQLIAHDKQVYDISFSNTPDIFASVGGDGSVRLFDLRNLEHSTILYETGYSATAQKTQGVPTGPALLRVCWNKLDNHFLATFQEDSEQIILLDTRLPSIPVAELNVPSLERNSLPSYLSDICWSPTSSSHLLSITDNGQINIWDLIQSNYIDVKHAFNQNVPSFVASAPLQNMAGSTVSPAFTFNLPNGTGCQVVWPQEAPDLIAATDINELYVIPI